MKAIMSVCLLLHKLLMLISETGNSPLRTLSVINFLTLFILIEGKIQEKSYQTLPKTIFDII